MKKLLIVSILLSIICNQPLQAKPLVLGYVDFPPYEFQEKEKPKGILINIVKEVFRRADIPIKLRFLPFKRAYEWAKVGKIDGLFNFYKVKERLEFFDYSEPIIKNALVFFIRKDSNMKFNSYKDLKGKKIGVMRGYTYGEKFDKSTDFGKFPVSSHKSNFSKLLYGRIDGYPCDKLVGIHVIRKNKIMSEFKMLPKALKVMDGHIGFTKGKHTKTIKLIDKILKEMHKKGTIDKIINKYIGSL